MSRRWDQCCEPQSRSTWVDSPSAVCSRDWWFPALLLRSAACTYESVIRLLWLEDFSQAAVCTRAYPASFAAFTRECNNLVPEGGHTCELPEFSSIMHKKSFVVQALYLHIIWFYVHLILISFLTRSRFLLQNRFLALVYCQISTDRDKILHTPIVVWNTLLGRLRLRSALGRLQAKPERLCFL